jgi:Uma2 family endonuclease
MDGELLVVPAPTTFHQIISQNMEFFLLRHVRATRCGRVLHAPVDVVLGEGKRRDVVQPDIVFISNDRARIVTKPEVVGAPDLVIEILSPGTEDRDRGYKKTLYERMGVREYWIVDPDAQAIEVFCAGPAGFAAPRSYGLNDEIAVTVIDGLRLPLREIFDLGI